MDYTTATSINLARLLKEGGTARAQGVVQEAFVVGEERFPLQGEASWRVAISSVGGNEYWLSGEVEGVVLMECRRCLRPTPTRIHAHFQHLLHYEPGLEEVVFHEEGEEDEVEAEQGQDEARQGAVEELVLGAGEEPGEPEADAFKEEGRHPRPGGEGRRVLRPPLPRRRA